MEQIIGWVGAFLYITAYFLLCVKKLKVENVSYQLMNIFGGICLIVNSFHQSDFPSVFTNLVWAGIGVFAIYYNRAR